MEKKEIFRADDLVQPDRDFQLRYMDPHDAHYLEKCGDLWNVYQKAFDDFAGPQRFRHSVNYNTYHLAGLIGLMNAAASVHYQRLADLLDAVNAAMPYFVDDAHKATVQAHIDRIAQAAETAKELVAA